MNILFVTPKINMDGGGSNSNTDLRIKTLLSSGHRIKVVTLFSDYNKLPRQNPYEIIPYYRKPRLWFFVNLFVYKILKKYDRETDLFYIDGPQFLWGAGLYKLFGKKPIILHLNVLPYVVLEHGTRLYPEDSVKISLLKKIKFWLRAKIIGYIDIILGGKIDSLTCTSPIIREQCIHFGFNKNNLDLLPEFIDTKIFLSHDKKRTLSKHRKHLLYVGRLVPCKGVDLLLKSLSYLKDVDIMLNIVGDGSEFSRLETLSRTLGVNNRVHFHKWIKRDELKTFYDEADIFVHPARWAEPLGITVVEAMMTELPVIVPKISGSAWVAGRAGLTFQNGDEKDLAEKITLLLNDDTLYEQLRSETKSEAQKLDYKEWQGKLEDLIKRLTN